MRPELLHLASDLAKRGEPFALVTVVRRGAPSSARVGDMALVTQGGVFHGWVGGSCTQPTVVREALRALDDRRPRLIALSPSPETDSRPGVATFPMTCHSGGSVDIYIEPVLPAPRLVVFGASPVGRALAQLGQALGYTVDLAEGRPEQSEGPAPACRPERSEGSALGSEVCRPERLPSSEAKGSEGPALGSEGPAPQSGPWLCAVVATMGDWDEDAIRAALALEPAYLGVVASRTRFAGIRETLLASGIAEETLANIRTPAGLDIGAESAEEVALSVLAEIVRVRRAAPPSAPPVVPAAEALDPVCGMTVVIANARHQAEFAGQNYYFCGKGCRERFLADPDRYLGVQPAKATT